VLGTGALLDRVSAAYDCSTARRPKVAESSIAVMRRCKPTASSNVGAVRVLWRKSLAIFAYKRDVSGHDIFGKTVPTALRHVELLEGLRVAAGASDCELNELRVTERQLFNAAPARPVCEVSRRV
jgi:hypothetical protein